MQNGGKMQNGGNMHNAANRFSPEKFWSEMEKYISSEAGLTPREAAKFFPVYREMWKKQRTLYERQQQLAKIKPADEKGCREAIKKNDELDVEIKQLQQAYHNKMLNILPASKLYDVIKSVDRFHRRELRRWGNGGMTGRNYSPRPGM